MTTSLLGLQSEFSSNVEEKLSVYKICKIAHMVQQRCKLMKEIPGTMIETSVECSIEARSIEIKLVEWVF